MCQGQQQSSCPVLELGLTELLVRRTIRASSNIVAEAGLSLDSPSLDASSSGGLNLVLPSENPVALRILEAGQSSASAMLTVDTISGKIAMS